MDTLGLYFSVPFCRAKCSFCNFASDAFAPGRLPAYVDELCREIGLARRSASLLDANLPDLVDTLYFGGGTPSLLSPRDIERIFNAIREQFNLAPEPEITVECAPNQISPRSLEEFQHQGVNRLSFGVQSFVDRESAAIGRLHTAEQCVAEIERVRRAGILNLSLDLISGLPYQTETSWRESVAEALDSGVPHLSVYMLEVDDESRLGREILAGGSRYGASSVPSDDDSAAFYETACDLLAGAGVQQYEISNFARPGFRSAHNLKYWRREPYLGFGVDAHSMLQTPSGSVRFANTADLDQYLGEIPRISTEQEEPFPLLATPLAEPSGRAVSQPRSSIHPPAVEYISPAQAFEETVFLGLRTDEGIRLADLRIEFGEKLVDSIAGALSEAAGEDLILHSSDTFRLTARGRVLSNEVFSRLLIPTSA